MAKLPTIKKILREDVKDAPAWIQGVIDPFNSLAEFVYQALNQNLTYSDNLACFIKEISYTTPSGYPTMDVVQFMNTLKYKATGVQLLQVYNTANYTPPPGPVSILWVENNGSILIYPTPGLEANKTYLMRLLIT